MNEIRIKRHSRCSNKEAVFAERFNKILWDHPKQTGFRKKFCKLDRWNKPVIKQYNNRNISSIKLKPIQAALKENENYVYKKVLDKREIKKPKFNLGSLVRTADKKDNLCKIDFSKEI